MSTFSKDKLESAQSYETIKYNPSQYTDDDDWVEGCPFCLESPRKWKSYASCSNRFCEMFGKVFTKKFWQKRGMSWKKKAKS